MTSILKVTEIQDPTNSNTAFSIDSSGRVTTPSKPAFIVSLKTNLSDATSGIVIFDTIVKQNGSGYSTSTGKFTAPVTGFYQLGHSLLLQNVASSDDAIHLRYRTNGADNDENTYLFNRADGSAANGTVGYQGYLNVVGSVLLHLESGDTADLYWTSSGAIGVHGNATGTWSRMYGYLVG